MTEFTPEHHDWVEPDELEALQNENQKDLRIADKIKYLGDLAVFRANFFTKMHRHDIIRGNEGWAIFDQFDDSDDLVSSRKDVAVHVRIIEPDNPTGMPTSKIRIITNEIIFSESGSQILTTDIGVDEEDDCLYFIDAIDPERQTTDESNAPVFVVQDDGRLGVTNNIRAYVPVVDIYGEFPQGTITPFGHYNSLRDKMNALEYAKTALQSIIHIEPSIQGPPTIQD